MFLKGQLSKLFMQHLHFEDKTTSGLANFRDSKMNGSVYIEQYGDVQSKNIYNYVTWEIRKCLERGSQYRQIENAFFTQMDENTTVSNSLGDAGMVFKVIISYSSTIYHHAVGGQGIGCLPKFDPWDLTTCA